VANGAADPEVLRVLLDPNSRIGERAGHGQRVVGAGVVDDDDAVNPFGDAAHDRGQVPAFVVGRQDDAVRDVLAHASTNRWRHGAVRRRVDRVPYSSSRVS